MTQSAIKYSLIISLDDEEPSYFDRNLGSGDPILERARDVNLCRTFILSISLFLKLGGSNLAQTLLNPPNVIWHCLFLLIVSVVFVNAEKRSVQNIVVFIKP